MVSKKFYETLISRLRSGVYDDQINEDKVSLLIDYLKYRMFNRQACQTTCITTYFRQDEKQIANVMQYTDVIPCDFQTFTKINGSTINKTEYIYN